MFFVQRATILQRLMTAHGVISTLIAVHSQKWPLVVSVGLVWLYGLVEVMFYEEYIRWKYGVSPTVVSQNLLYHELIPGHAWYVIPVHHLVDKIHTILHPSTILLIKFTPYYTHPSSC